jgi:hypothetical protein
LAALSMGPDPVCPFASGVEATIRAQTLATRSA